MTSSEVIAASTPGTIGTTGVDPAAMMIRSPHSAELPTVRVWGSANLASPKMISAPVRASDAGCGWNSLTISRCRRMTVGQSSSMGPPVVPKRAASFAIR